VCVLLLLIFCWTNIFRDFAHDGTVVYINTCMIIDKGKRLPIVVRRHKHFEFSPSNRFILKKNSPACSTDVVLRKYWDASAICISFGPLFNNGNQNPFYIELTKTDNYYRECMGNRWDLQGGHTNSKYDRYIKSQFEIWYIDIINCFKYISYYNILAIYITEALRRQHG
jgi:hypothetical protein